MYKHFGNIGEKLPLNIFYLLILLNVVRTTRIAPTLFNLFHFLSAYAMRILILIRRRGIGPLCLVGSYQIYSNASSKLLKTYIAAPDNLKRFAMQLKKSSCLKLQG